MSCVDALPGKAQLDKRSAILEVARVAFCELGYEGTAMAAVAQGAGVAPNTIYWYFKSKDALLAAVLDREVEQALASYVALGEVSFDVRINWIIDRYMLAKELVAAVRGRVGISDILHDWAEGFQARISRFFVDRLLLRGFSFDCASSITAVGFNLVEGLSVNAHSPEARALSIEMIRNALASALVASGRIDAAGRYSQAK